MAELLRTVLLQLDPARNDMGEGEEMRDGFSAVAHIGEELWIASDETASLERLTTRDGGATFGEQTSFPLNELLDLPAGGDEEVDIEGIAYEEPYLWFVGSHSVKRKKPGNKPDDDTRDRIKRLAKIVVEPNRYVLARIPMVRDAESGRLAPCRSCTDPADPSRTLTAARLKGDGLESALMVALAEDKHLKPFLEIPGKDNGLDIEGLAIHGNRVFLGLRGPVLRGWAVVLEVEVEAKDGSEWLKLKEIGPKGRPYLRHFLDLSGLGVRELATDGRDLILLAGPTLDLDGPVALFRWRNAFDRSDESLAGQDEVQRIANLPHGHGETEGFDHAEGMTHFTAPGVPSAVLIVYDAPTDARKDGAAGLVADVFAIGGGSEPSTEGAGHAP